MSGIITAVATTAVTAYMGYEQNRMARAAQREQNKRITQEEQRIADEMAFNQRKKQEQDTLMSRNALRLRNSGATAPGVSPLSSIGGASLNQPLDKLGL